MALIDWSKITLTDPPQMPREVLRELKKVLMVLSESFRGDMVKQSRISFILF